MSNIVIINNKFQKFYLIAQEAPPLNLHTKKIFLRFLLYTVIGISIPLTLLPAESTPQNFTPILDKLEKIGAENTILRYENSQLQKIYLAAENDLQNTIAINQARLKFKDEIITENNKSHEQKTNKVIATAFAALRLHQQKIQTLEKELKEATDKVTLLRSATESNLQTIDIQKKQFNQLKKNQSKSEAHKQDTDSLTQALEKNNQCLDKSTKKIKELNENINNLETENKKLKESMEQKRNNSLFDFIFTNSLGGLFIGSLWFTHIAANAQERNIGSSLIAAFGTVFLWQMRNSYFGSKQT